MSEFQAIIFAGGQGNRMATLVSEHFPKALLPMANLPLFWYPLNLLSRHGIRDCILVVLSGHRADIENSLKNNQLPPLPGLHIEVVSFEVDGESQEEVDQWGTADVAKRLIGKLKSDQILLVSGDLVTDVHLDAMLRRHMEQKATLSCLLTDSALGGPVPGPKERAKKYRDFVLLDSDDDSDQHRQLLYLMDEEDFVEEEEGIPMAHFIDHTNVLATARYKDVHLYAIQRKALEVLGTDCAAGWTSLKADLIPHLLLSGHKCMAWIPTRSDCSLIAQCNNVGAYFEANKAILKLLPKLSPVLSARHFDKATGVNCVESWVDSSVELGQKCQLKRTIIGGGCTVDRGAKLENSVVMARVRIAEGAVLKNSIVFDESEIGANAELTMCIVGPGQKIKPKVKLANTVISEERTMDLDNN